MADYPYFDNTINYARITDSTINYARIRTSTEGSAETDSGNQSTAGSYTFDNYQDDAGITAVYPNAGTETNEAINYCVLGLIGEAGEIANKWKKFFRDIPSFARDSDAYYLEIHNRKAELRAELGDVLWYAAQLATELGVPLGEVAAANVRKLQKRKSEGTITGSGDNR